MCETIYSRSHKKSQLVSDDPPAERETVTARLSKPVSDRAKRVAKLRDESLRRFIDRAVDGACDREEKRRDGTPADVQKILNDMSPKLPEIALALWHLEKTNPDLARTLAVQIYTGA